MSRRLRIAARTAALAAAMPLCALGAPASATAGVGVVVAPAVGIPTAGTYNAVPQCNATLGVVTSLNQVTLAVAATSESYATDGTLVIASGVYCVVKDRVTGAWYGSTTPRALPGPMAVSEGVISVPFSSDPMMCGYANALFANTATATGKTSDPKC